jgi:hypothetical protein
MRSAMLCYLNACHRLLHPDNAEWPRGEPIGIAFDLAKADDKDKDLAIAYAFLKVPIQLPDAWKIPDDYSLQDAQAALLSDHVKHVQSDTNRLVF